MMEHIVQFAIGIDDNAIKKRIEENAYDDILEKNRDDIIDAAAEKLCESFKRTKAYKEKMTEVMETQTIPPIKIPD